MSRSKPSLLARPLQWLKLVFATRISVQRRGAHLKMVFEDTAYRSTQAQSRSGPQSAPEPAVQQMCSSLGTLLDQHSHARKVLRHLCMLEKALKRSGAKAFEDLPAEALKTALLQLDSLGCDRSKDPGLAELREQLCAHQGAIESEQPSELGGSKLSDFCTSRNMQVKELSASAFDDMAKSWLGRPPPELMRRG
jgi:hypothetical protein